MHIDGNPVRSCLLRVGAVGDRAVTTIEGVAATEVGAKVQKAWLDLEVIQCGYCQSGQIMSAAALLANNPHPDDADINAAMAGNERGRALISALPANRVLTETDGPFTEGALGPAQPSDIHTAVGGIAEARGVTIDTVHEQLIATLRALIAPG